jgi:hypothetical protein
MGDQGETLFVQLAHEHEHEGILKGASLEGPSSDICRHICDHL